MDVQFGTSIGVYSKSGGHCNIVCIEKCVIIKMEHFRVKKINFNATIYCKHIVPVNQW